MPRHRCIECPKAMPLMIRKLVFWLVLAPLAIVILMFAVANREIVTVSFDPFSTSQPAASVSVPLFVLIFILVILGVVIGGVAAWLRQSVHRRNARVHASDVSALRREVETLNAKMTSGDRPSSDTTARIAYRSSARG